MEVNFDPNKGKKFSFEVGFFDSILEIKEQIEKRHGIPKSKQSLFFEGSILPDELNVHKSNLVEGACVHLKIDSDHDMSIKSEDLDDRKIQLLLKMPTSKLGIALTIDITDTIQSLKEKIHEMENFQVSRLLVQLNGIELQDHLSLLDYLLFENSEIDVSIKPATTSTSPTGSSGMNSGGVKKLKVVVLTKCGKRKVQLEVNPLDNVRQLRKELQNLDQQLQLNLPEEGYFFIYKQNVMDDDRSFRWHHVAQGDTIEIFNGSVTGGV